MIEQQRTRWKVATQCALIEGLVGDHPVEDRVLFSALFGQSDVRQEREAQLWRDVLSVPSAKRFTHDER